MGNVNSSDTVAARLGLSRLTGFGAHVFGATWTRSTAVRAYRRVKNFRRTRQLTHELNRWKARRAEIIDAGRRRPNARLDVLALNPSQIRALEREARRDGVAVLAGIDRDGYWESRIGRIAGVPTLADGSFVPRRKFCVDVVWSPDYFGVRKHYRGNRLAFLNELSALHRFSSLGLRVPSILDVQFDDPTLVMSYIPGQVLLEELVKAGAFVRNRDQAPDLRGQEKRDRDLLAGREVLPRVVSMAFVSQLARDLRRFHEAGSLLIDIKWGNIIIGTDGHPWWIDFHMTEDHSELSRESFQALADLDVQRFNRVYGTNLPTMNVARRAA